MSQVSPEYQPLASSFRDPAGFVFESDGEIYRHIATDFMPSFQHFMDCGLYDALVQKNYLVRHEVIKHEPQLVIKPEQVPYVSYPYEWCFSELKAAALLTLRIQKLALSFDMTLKDASSYNVQFFGCHPKFIDTLSFDALDPVAPWVAYRQFCEHFLAPLALMAYSSPTLNRLMQVYLDGVPLQVAADLLPTRTKFKYSLLAHVHLHARSQRVHADAGKAEALKARPMNKQMHDALIDSLRRAVEQCRLTHSETEWGAYYDDTNYSDEAMREKEAQVNGWVEAHALPGELIHDIGANTGRFSKLAAAHGHQVVAHDVDWLAVERHYQGLMGDAQLKDKILPLQLDLTNPTPAIGWANQERLAFADRSDSGFVLALALIHHLAISNNTPLPKIATFLARFARKLVIEFVPKEDSQVRRLLATREDIFSDYHVDGFETAVAPWFRILERTKLSGSERTLYLLERL